LRGHKFAFLDVEERRKLSLDRNEGGRNVVHRRWQLAVLLGLMAVAAASLTPGQAQQQKRWAAIDPNSETSSPVVWGANEEEARNRAMEACKRVSKTCANGPAVTDDLREVFALVCCAKPKTGCAAAVASNKREASRNAQQMFTDAGYSDCAVRHFLGASTGRKQ
jgi:hypothetical protein